MLAAEIRERRARGRKVGPRFVSVRGKQLGRFLFKQRLNVDQVPLPFVVGDYEHTIDEKGAKDVWVRQPGSGLEKRQATLQICLRAGVDDLGNNLPQLPIAIIFRGTGQRITEAEKRAYDPRVHVYFQKCAWVDMTVAIEWQNRTLIPCMNEHLPGEESVIFADNPDAQIQEDYIKNQKGKGRAVGWSLLKDGTYWAQPIDQGAGREWVLMTWWVGGGYERTCGRVGIHRYFTKSGCNLNVTCEGDDEITPEGLDTFTFERPTIPAVIQENPVQQQVAPISHTELQKEVEEQELQELDSEESEDECTDEEEKWFLPDGCLSEYLN
ncbi:hypothetical protein CYMTET_8440 [Cymbomonas tetramitiformis]|uniref:DDE-1 domain-containing protein n=1 Tax=Cymbomonas tetramitiformis TaxID=36881 RepID=A0AAE0GTE0_9CHLO|nr:hypothetical protein CYMTET_8440 [Cymbomonas tetramitiformis]